MAVKSVLVIESDHNTRVEIRKMLESEGHFVISSANGAEALTQIDKMSAPSLILVGNSLAMISADQLLALLKQIPSLRDIPIAQLKSEGDAVLVGACYVLDKPVSREELLECLKNC